MQPRLRFPTGASAFDASEDFDHARRRAFGGLAWRRLSGRGRASARRPPSEVVAGSVPRLEVVPLRAIVGSVEGAPWFDAELRPTSPRVRRRWQSIATAARHGADLPPITVWRYGDELFVLDGHHRVSVARELRRTDIEAWVLEGVGPRT